MLACLFASSSSNLCGVSWLPYAIRRRRIISSESLCHAALPLPLLLSSLCPCSILPLSSYLYQAPGRPAVGTPPAPGSVVTNPRRGGLRVHVVFVGSFSLDGDSTKRNGPHDDQDVQEDERDCALLVSRGVFFSSFPQGFHTSHQGPDRIDQIDHLRFHARVILHPAECRFLL